jgi:ATP-dependent helicase HepA
VPPDLDALTQDVVVSAAERLGFTVERQRGRRAYSIELGESSLVDGLPGVPGGSLFVGSFDREEAVEREDADFFASGHPLVEGLFAFLDDSALGRAVRVEIEIGGDPGRGLVAVYKDASGFEVIALDDTGRARPDWAAAIRDRSVPMHRVSEPDPDDEGVMQMVRRLTDRLDRARRPYAVAAVVVRPRP